MNHRIAFENFLRDFQHLYQEILESGDQESILILQDIGRKASIFGRVNLILSISASVFFVSYPLIAGNRSLPYGLYIPIPIDYRASPTYEIVFAFQAFCTFVGCLMYISFSNFFISFVVFGIILCKELQRKFKAMTSSSCNKIDNDLIERQLKQNIQYHERVIRYIKEINDLLSLICLVEMISFALIVSALLFMIIIVDKTSQLIMGVSFIVVVLMQLFAIYWISNELIEEVIYLTTDDISASSVLSV